jgi:hypothetical protein
MHGRISELVRDAFDAFNRRDVDALLALSEPNVRVRSLMTEAERETYDGHQGVREWLAAITDIFPDLHPEPRPGGADLGNALFTPFCVTATATASGVPIDETFWAAARMSEAGRLVYVGFFRTEAEARQAARPISSIRYPSGSRTKQMNDPELRPPGR